MFGNFLTRSKEAKEKDVLLSSFFLFCIDVDKSYYIV